MWRSAKRITKTALKTAAKFASRSNFLTPNTSRSIGTSLNGWNNDDHEAAFATYLASCRALNIKQRRSNSRANQKLQLTGIAAALRDVCDRAQAAIPLDDDGARKFFEENFRPLHIDKLGDTAGFLTGYYEPIIDGSRVPTGDFTAPLYRRPPNLVASGRRKLGDAFPSKGVFVGRRVGRRKIVPYYTRAEIEDGALDGWHLEICYLHDPVDVSVRADSRIGARPARRRHHSARQLRLT